MKIFLAGATGALGRRLVPMLVSAGHHVVGMTRTPGKTVDLLAAGAEPVIADALDRDAVMQAVLAARPDMVVHEMTSLKEMRDFTNFDRELAVTNRLRTEGTEHLLAAAQAAGVRRIVAQSFTGWTNQRTGGRIKTEQDPFDPNPPKSMRQTLAAIRRLEAMVLDAGGIALRYGFFYGPGTAIAADGDVIEMLRRRKFPIVGSGAAVWSFIHIDDAAQATLRAIESGRAGKYNIVDDDPAELSVWLPVLAQAVGAKPPRHIPDWLGRLMLGEGGMSMMTQIRGSSNAAAKRALDWHLIYPTWREGFRHGLAATPHLQMSQAKS